MPTVGGTAHVALPDVARLSPMITIRPLHNSAQQRPIERFKGDSNGLTFGAQRE
jgi:hypothetical protein